MVTTTEQTDLLDVDFKPRKSAWAKATSRLKNFFVGFIGRHELLCCCFGSEELQMVQEDNRRRVLIRESMRSRLGMERVDDPITGVIDDVFDSTRYNLAGRRTVMHWVGRDAGMTDTAWEAIQKKAVEDRTVKFVAPHMSDEEQTKFMSAYAEANSTVKFVPRFAGVMAMVIRTRLGKMRSNEANILLVRREYNRLARERGVRPQDIVAHEQYVVNAVFTETLFDEIATSRPRLPRWARWMTEVSSGAHADGAY